MGQAKRRKQQQGALYGTPEGSNSRPPASAPKAASIDVLGASLSREDLTEVSHLLNHGPTNWERRYSPAPGLALTTAAVIVRCTGEVATVEMVPAVGQP
jgi:hypothetical protein